MLVSASPGGEGRLLVIEGERLPLLGLGVPNELRFKDRLLDIGDGLGVVDWRFRVEGLTGELATYFPLARFLRN